MCCFINLPFFPACKHRASELSFSTQNICVQSPYENFKSMKFVAPLLLYTTATILSSPYKDRTSLRRFACPIHEIFTCRQYQMDFTVSALATDNRSFILFNTYFKF